MIQNYDNLTILSDKIKDLKLKNLPPNLILNKNNKYTLSLNSNKFIMTYIVNNKTNPVTAYIPLRKNIPYTKLVVNWDANGVNNMISTYTSTTYLLSCVYPKNTNTSDISTYKIEIMGDFKGLYNNILQLKTNYLYNINNSTTQIIPGTRAINFNYYLQSIDSWGSVPIESLSYFCAYASGLSKIPNMPLPNVNNCDNTFLNCINLKKCFLKSDNNMNQFQLPKNATNCNNMFRNTNIEYDFSTLAYPEYLNITSAMFANTKIIGLNTQFYTKYLKACWYNTEYTRLLSTYYKSTLPKTAADSVPALPAELSILKDILIADPSD